MLTRSRTFAADHLAVGDVLPQVLANFAPHDLLESRVGRVRFSWPHPSWRMPGMALVAADYAVARASTLRAAAYLVGKRDHRCTVCMPVDGVHPL